MRTTRFQNGNAIIESIVALLALSPFIVGVPLLGKQLDLKQKTYDAARYATWERTVWRSDGTSNRKSEESVSLEARDRALGHPSAGILDVEELRSRGVTENPLWRDGQRRRLLHYQDNDAPIDLTYSERRPPVDVGYRLVPGIAHGGGALRVIQEALQLDGLDLNPRAYVGVDVAIGWRPLLRERAERSVALAAGASSGEALNPLVHGASGGILSDTWTARDEANLRDRVDGVTVDELLEQLEQPGRLIGMQALGKGRPLYGEGQFGWEPDLRPRSNNVPAAYVDRR